MNQLTAKPNSRVGQLWPTPCSECDFGEARYISWMAVARFTDRTADPYITCILYPASQAIWQSLFIPDPFGLSAQFVGGGNFEFLFSDPYYLASFLTTATFSLLVTISAMVPALFLAVMADRLIKGWNLSDDADLALCSGPGCRRCSLAFHVQHQGWCSVMVPRAAWL